MFRLLRVRLEIDLFISWQAPSLRSACGFSLQDFTEEAILVVCSSLGNSSTRKPKWFLKLSRGLNKTFRQKSVTILDCGAFKLNTKVERMSGKCWKQKQSFKRFHHSANNEANTEKFNVSLRLLYNCWTKCSNGLNAINNFENKGNVEPMLNENLNQFKFDSTHFQQAFNVFTFSNMLKALFKRSRHLVQQSVERMLKQMLKPFRQVLSVQCACLAINGHKSRSWKSLIGVHRRSGPGCSKAD